MPKLYIGRRTDNGLCVIMLNKPYVLDADKNAFPVALLNGRGSRSK